MTCKTDKYSKIKLVALTLISVILLVLSGCNQSDTLELSGTIESTQISVNSEVAGKVIKTDKSEGEKVLKGDTLAAIDSSIQELAVKQQEAILKLKQAKLDDLKAASTTSSNPKKSNPIPSVSENSIKAAEADLEQSQAALEQSKLILSKYQIKAPSDGTYLLRNINVGDIVNTGASIGTISDLTDLYVKVYIPEKNKNLITLNQEINLKAKSLSNEMIKGKITYIANEAEFTPKNTETSEAKENTVFKVKIKILDHLDQLNPGMTLDALIPTGGK